MKRSEMVNTIAIFLEEWYGEELPLKIADRLLVTMEKAGMQPPMTIYDMRGNVVENTWDVEDEA